jgi:L-alanine-DL-glutamate epimerase-like enolase superfamily enzyme
MRRAITIRGLTPSPLSVPLVEPFVIATGRMDATRAALVRVELEDDRGARAVGLGEAAALPPVTHEDQPDLLDGLAAAAGALHGARVADTDELSRLLDATFVHRPVARAAVETAVLDAWARLKGLPLHDLLRGRSAAAPALVTDVTLPIATPAHMAELAAGWAARGFDCFKVKVGIDWHADLACLRAAHAAVPAARFRLDANAGFTARDAIALLDAAVAAGLELDCFEQPCARDDLAGMAAVSAHSAVPVVADESCRGADDLARLVDARACTGVNLKLVKLGGPLAALDVGRRARAAGLSLMAGAMVETRLGLAAMAHVVAALGGVDWVDLDTAFLLAGDPFDGGTRASGPRLELVDGAGLTVSVRPPPGA